MAITEKYVNNAGAGAHDGSNDANAFSWAEMITDINAGSKAGNRYNVKQDGTYSRTTTADTLSAGGSATSPVIIRGYKTAIGDCYLGRSSVKGGSLDTTNMPVITYTTVGLTLGTWTILEGFNIASAKTGATITPNNDNIIRGCKVVNSSTASGIFGFTAGQRTIIQNNDIEMTGASGGATGAAVSAGAASMRVAFNRIKGGPALGISLGSTAVVYGNVIFGGARDGIAMNSTAGSPAIIRNLIYGHTGDGIDIITGTTGLQCIIENMITDNGGYGIDGVSAANAIMVAFNRYRDNALGSTNLGTDWLAATGWGNVDSGSTGTIATDYTAAGSSDFSLVYNGPAIRAAAWGNDIGPLAFYYPTPAEVGAAAWADATSPVRGLS